MLTSHNNEKLWWIESVKFSKEDMSSWPKNDILGTWDQFYVKQNKIIAIVIKVKILAFLTTRYDTTKKNTTVFNITFWLISYTHNV